MLKKHGPNSMAGLTLGEVAELYEQIDDLTARVVKAEIKTAPSPLRLTRAEIDARAVRLWGEIDYQAADAADLQATYQSAL
jgi:hypothetical protein